MSEWVYSYRGLSFDPPVSRAEAEAQFDSACENGNRVCLMHREIHRKKAIEQSIEFGEILEDSAALRLLRGKS